MAMPVPIGQVKGCPQCNCSRRAFLGASAAGLASMADGSTAFAVGPGPGTANKKIERTADAGVGGQIVDFHAHIFDEGLPPIIDLRSSGVNGATWLEALRSPRAHIAHMDEIGVDAHVVGYGNAIHGISWGDAEADLALLRASNDRLSRNWVQAHPSRFHGAFGLPTQELRLAVPELERAVNDLGLSVLQLSSHDAIGRYYGDPTFDPLWEAVEGMGVTVFIHPHGQNRAPPFDDFSLANSVGQGVEEIRVMTSIIYNGVFDKFPGLKIVIAHGGGFLPHYYGRLDRNAYERPQTMRNISKLPSEYLKNFYYDTAVYAPEILAALIRVVGADRIVLGSDYPVGESNGRAALRYAPGLTEADLERIIRTTPSQLLSRGSRPGIG